MTLRSRLVALATSICERQIEKRLGQMADAGEVLTLDPDATAVIELREHCRRESESEKIRRRDLAKKGGKK